MSTRDAASIAASHERLRAARDARDAAQESYNQAREDYDRCTSNSGALQSAREALQEAIRYLYEVTNEAINKVNEYKSNVQHADQSRREFLARKLADLENFRGTLRDMKDSFSEVGGLYSQGIPLLDLTNAKATLEWIQVHNILRQPATRITPEQFFTVAQFFVSQDTLAGKQRFINALAEPFGVGPGFVPFEGGNLFTFCSSKIGGLQRALDFQIETALQMQMGLDSRSLDFISLNDMRETMMRRHGLLTAVAMLPNWPLDGPPGSRLTQYVLIGGPNGAVTLSHGMSPPHGLGGVTISAQSARAIITQQGDGSSSIELCSFSQPQDHKIHVSNVHIGCEELSLLLANAELNYFLLKHEFNLNAYLSSRIRSAITSALAPKKDLAATALGILEGVPAAQAQAERHQQDFVDFANEVRFTSYLRVFELNAVLIQVHDTPTVQTHTWASPSSQNGLNALNQVLSEINEQNVMMGKNVLPHNEITMESFIQDSMVGLDTFNNLSPSQVGRIMYLRNEEN